MISYNLWPLELINFYFLEKILPCIYNLQVPLSVSNMPVSCLLQYSTVQYPASYLLPELNLRLSSEFLAWEDQWVTMSSRAPDIAGRGHCNYQVCSHLSILFWFCPCKLMCYCYWRYDKELKYQYNLLFTSLTRKFSVSQNEGDVYLFDIHHLYFSQPPLQKILFSRNAILL